MTVLAEISERWNDLMGRSRHATALEPEDDEIPVNRAGVEGNDDIRRILADEDQRSALLGLIDSFAAESLRATMDNRADHAVLLGHLGAYARLQDLRVELGRLAGLTDD